jgi:sec-independent protein translocase protein TatA
MIPSIGISEMVVIGIVAILLFGSRLPLVARNIGRSYGELRKGLTELKSTINTEIEETERRLPDRTSSTNRTIANTTAIDDYDEPTAPRLSPPVKES